MIPRDDMGEGIESVKGWAVDFEKLWESVGGCFFRHDLRCRAKRYVCGLLGRVERKNGWQMAEYLGDATPHPVQRLLDRSVWNADDVRDEIIRYLWDVFDRLPSMTVSQLHELLPDKWRNSHPL
jgi:hypothetical protein